MPWDIFREDGKHCVYKVNEGDNSRGEKVKCHDTEDEAKAHMSALYAAESDDDKTEKAFVNVNVPDGMGLRQWASHIEYAWDEKTEEDLRYSQVREVFDGHIIVARGYGMNAKLYKVPYTVSDDLTVTFNTDDMKEVEMKVEWSEKSIGFSDRLAIKSISEDRVGAYGVLWGDETKKDAHDEYFDKDTQDMLNIFNSMGAIPFLFHHGGDGKIKSTVIGKVDVMEPDDVGLWYEAKITEQELYKDYVSRFIKDGRLYSSSGTLPAAKSVEQNGHITSWPIVEMTGTWVPAEYRMMLGGHTVNEVKAHYKSIGLDIDLGEEEDEENQLTNKNEDGNNETDDNTTAESETDVADTVEDENVDLLKVELELDSLYLEQLELDLTTL